MHHPVQFIQSSGRLISSPVINKATYFHSGTMVHHYRPPSPPTPVLTKHLPVSGSHVSEWPLQLQGTQ